MRRGVLPRPSKEDLLCVGRNMIMPESASSSSPHNTVVASIFGKRERNTDERIPPPVFFRDDDDEATGADERVARTLLGSPLEYYSAAQRGERARLARPRALTPGRGVKERRGRSSQEE